VRLTGWLAALVACADPQTRPADPTAPVQAPDYTQPGPWSAGTAEGTVTGRDGEPLVVQWWYPTTEPGSPVTYDGLFPGEATADAPVDCSAVRPLLAFSHGSGGIRFQSTFFTEFAATHGFVVVAPDHRGNTFLDAAPDFTELVGRRPHDVEDVVDATLADDRFADCLDGDAYSVVGHSFGGYTALALAGAELVDPAGGTMSRLDPRVTAAVGLAPWDAAGTIDGGTSEIDVPTLILTGALDETTPLPQVRGLFDPLGSDERWLGVFPDAGHYSFSPVACLLFTGDGCGDEFLALDVLEDLVNVSVLAVVGHQQGQAGALEQLPLDAPELEWEVHAP
jgi:predicted dienelactone hydrolase